MYIYTYVYIYRHVIYRVYNPYVYMCGKSKVCKDHDAEIAVGVEYNIHNSCMSNYGDLRKELRPLVCSCAQEYPPGYFVAGPPGLTSVMIESLCPFFGAIHLKHDLDVLYKGISLFGVSCTTIGLWFGFSLFHIGGFLFSPNVECLIC